MSQPPPGGFGAPPTQGPAGPIGPMAPPGAPRGGGGGTALIIVLVVVGVLVIGGGILATLAIYGVRKYIATAKQAEARNSLAYMGRGAVAAYEAESLDAPSRGTSHTVCPSARSPVPRDAALIRGRKYMSSAAEWEVDRPAHAGFACVGFQMVTPQYYQYDWHATPTGFTATARGDLDGNDVMSTFSLQGHVTGGNLTVAPVLSETSPDE